MKGSKTGIIVFFVIWLVFMIISGVMKNNANDARRRSLSSMNATVERLYSTDDPDYNRTIASDIRAEQSRRTVSIARDHASAVDFAHIVAFLGWLCFLAALIGTMGYRKRLREADKKGQYGVSS